VSEELVAVMRAAGFSRLMSSPDSASPAMLERLKKNFTVDDLIRAAGGSGPAACGFLVFHLRRPGRVAGYHPRDP